MDTIEFDQKYPVSEQLVNCLTWLAKSQGLGNIFEHLVMIRVIGIRDQIFDQEYVKYNMKRYLSGEDRDTTGH